MIRRRRARLCPCRGSSGHAAAPGSATPPELPARRRAPACRACSTAGLQTVAARGLFFAANLEALAEKVADQVDGKFNALHL